MHGTKFIEKLFAGIENNCKKRTKFERKNKKKFKKNFFSSRKTLKSRLSIKSLKKIFFGQIGHHFFAAHTFAFGSKILKNALFDR